MKAFTNALFLTDRNFATFRYCLSIATVDVYGCDYITANGVLYLYIIIGRITPCGGVYHIGVGSSVVCSTVSGNAKASISGTDNSSSTLFCVVTGGFITHKKIRL